MSPESFVNQLSCATCTTNRIGTHSAINLKCQGNVLALRLVAFSCVLHQVLDRQLDWNRKGSGWYVLGAKGTFGQPASDRCAQEREPGTKLGFICTARSLLMAQ